MRLVLYCRPSRKAYERICRGSCEDRSIFLDAKTSVLFAILIFIRRDSKFLNSTINSFGIFICKLSVAT